MNLQHWTYKGKKFTDEDIPEGAVGFVYYMFGIDDEDRFWKYIGKKNFYSNRKKRFGKKKLAAMTDQRKKKYEIITKLDYQNYCSSNQKIKQLAKDGFEIYRVISHICYSKIEMTYYEAKFLFEKDVLNDSKYLNDNILGKFYKNKV